MSVDDDDDDDDDFLASKKYRRIKTRRKKLTEKVPLKLWYGSFQPLHLISKEFNSIH